MEPEGLNPAQHDAVEHGDGPLLILAGAGSGKTRVITHRLAKLVARGVAPWRILAVTFTNKAAGEMRSRAVPLLGEERARKLWIGTFHSTAAKLLRMYGESVGIRRDFQIYDDDDQKKLAARVMTDLGISDRVLTVRALLSRIDQAKNEGVSVSEFAPEVYLEELVAQAWPEYQRRLRAANAVDFGDLLVEALALVGDPEAGPELRARFDHVLVDEFQDTNRVQYRLVRGLAQTRNLCVVGDDDQAIYRWRGADVRNILDFERDYGGCKVVKLERNYRSTQVILEAANGVIARNTNRRPKRLYTEIAGGDPVVYFTAGDERREAEFIANAIRQVAAAEGRELSDFAVLYRMHAQSRALEEALRNLALPYKIYGGVRFFDRAEVKDLLAYLRVIANPADQVSLERIVNVPTRGIGDTTIEKLSRHALRSGLSLWQAMRAAVGAQGSAVLPSPVRPRRAAAPASDDQARLFSDEELDAGGGGNSNGDGEGEEDLDGAALLGTGPRRKLAGFVKLIDELRQRAQQGLMLAELAAQTLDATGLLERLQGDSSPEARDRIGNLEELLNSIRDYEREAASGALGEGEGGPDRGLGGEPTLVGYLERVSLMSAADATGGGVTLMTVHAAKGLEFPVVFLAGLEEGTFPLLGEGAGIEDLEDERRLAYVAITRARQRLVLTNAAHRRLWNRGERRLGFNSAPLDADDPFSLRESRFIGDIPEGCIARPASSRRPAVRPGRGVGEGRRHGGDYPDDDDDDRPASAARREERGDGSYVERDEEGGEHPVSGPARRTTVASTSSGERYVDYDDGVQVSGGFRVGQRVKHASFGEGRVRQLQGSGQGLRLVVEFPAIGETKTVVARYLQPA